MSLYRRGKVWWFCFNFRGQRIQESTRQTNKRVAEQIQAARRSGLAKGEAGIEIRKVVPIVRGFAVDFMKAIESQCSGKPRTVEFYRSKLKSLLKVPFMGGASLDAVDEEMVERYKRVRMAAKSRRKKALSPGSINRELATLRRLLRLAFEWKLINRVPRIRMIKGERNREFVLTHQVEPLYLGALPETLQDVATLLLDTGLRLGEALSLEGGQVKLTPAMGAKYGYLTVLSGKAKSGKGRNVPLTARAVEVLRRWVTPEGGLVFRRPDGRKLAGTLLGQQHKRVRELLHLPEDFVLHSLRHTFGSRLGEAGVDVFTIMRLMGHSTITISQRYVHPSPESMESAFDRLNSLNLQNVPTVPTTADEPEEQTTH
jgi:integrase